MIRGNENHPSFLTRAVAVLSIGLLLALAVLAASPALHERLHGHPLRTATALPGTGHDGRAPAPDDDDGCVVTLFSQGLVLPLVLVAMAAIGPALRRIDFVLFDRIVPEAPRYLRLPAQGPPVGLS